MNSSSLRTRTPVAETSSSARVLRARQVLVADAALSGASGGLLLALGGWVAGHAELSSGASLRWIGAGLLAWAVVMAAARTDRAARLTARATAVGDAVWVVASVVVTLVADLPAWAIAMVLAQAAVVAGVAVTKLAVSR